MLTAKPAHTSLHTLVNLIPNNQIPVVRLGICLGSTLMTPLMFGMPFPPRPSDFTNSGSRVDLGDDCPFSNFLSAEIFTYDIYYYWYWALLCDSSRYMIIRNVSIYIL